MLNSSPYRVGIDLVDVRNLQDSLDRFGKRFLERIFTSSEQAYCLGLSSQQAIAQSLAARFAAKEATLKVLRPEQASIDWRSIEIRRWPAGNCDLVLHADAAVLAQQRGITALSLSMSHEVDYATAIVVADF